MSNKKRQSSYDQSVEMNVCDIRFTQKSVNDTFSNGAPIQWTIHMLNTGVIEPDEIPLIRVGYLNGSYKTIDNRRLYCFKTCNIKKIRVTLVDNITEEFFCKDQSTNKGQTVQIIHDPKPQSHHKNVVTAYNPITKKIRIWSVKQIINEIEKSKNWIPPSSEADMTFSDQSHLNVEQHDHEGKKEESTLQFIKTKQITNKKWYCETCNRNIASSGKASHFKGRKHKKKIKKLKKCEKIKNKKVKCVYVKKEPESTSKINYSESLINDINNYMEEDLDQYKPMHITPELKPDPRETAEDVHGAPAWTLDNNDEIINTDFKFGAVIDKEKDRQYYQQFADIFTQEEYERRYKQNYMDVNLIVNSPHGNLSIKQLQNMNFRQTNVCYIKGLPINVAQEHILRQNEWFGSFGKIINIIFPQSKQDKLLESQTISITYDNNISVSNAINYCMTNKFIFDNPNRKIKATHGLQQYCVSFLQNINCMKSSCGLKHSWYRNEDIMTKQDTKAFKSLSYGAQTFRPLPNAPVMSENGKLLFDDVSKHQTVQISNAIYTTESHNIKAPHRPFRSPITALPINKILSINKNNVQSNILNVPTNNVMINKNNVHTEQKKESTVPTKQTRPHVQKSQKKTIIYNHPHGPPCTVEDLMKIRFYKRNVCDVFGLPLNTKNEIILRSNEWFAKFGNVVDVFFPGQDDPVFSKRVQITFETNQSVINAIKYINDDNFKFSDGRKLKAAIKIAHYCNDFLLPNQQCTKYNCKKIHSWLTEQDVVSKEELVAFHQIPYGIQCKKINEQWIIPHPLLLEIKNASVAQSFKYKFKLTNNINYLIKLFPNGKCKSHSGFVEILCRPWNLNKICKNEKFNISCKLEFIELNKSLPRRTSRKNGAIIFLKLMKLSDIQNCDSLTINIFINILKINIDETVLKPVNETNNDEIVENKINNEQLPRKTKFNIRQQLLTMGFKFDDIQHAFTEYEKRYDYSYSDSVERIVYIITDKNKQHTSIELNDAKPASILRNKSKSKKQKRKEKKQEKKRKKQDGKQRKNRILQTVIADSPHGSNLTVEYLTKIVFWNKLQCLVFGLEFEKKQILFSLASKEWFGKFGNIINITAFKKRKYVEIEFENEYATLNAISYCNNDESTVLRARYTTTNYCKSFLISDMQCTDNNCKKIHSWQTPNDVVTDQLQCKLIKKEIDDDVEYKDECTNVIENNANQFEQLQAKCQQQTQEIIDLKKQLSHYLQEIETYKQKCDMLQTEISENINNLCEEKFKCWLCEVVRLKEYLSTFVQNEYNDITLIEFIDQDVIKNELGITNKIHIQLLLTRIDEFKRMRQSFDVLITRNDILKQFERNLIKNGILTINDLKKDIKTKVDAKRILKINNQTEIEQILSIIHVHIST